jgi:hypothetical protein
MLYAPANLVTRYPIDFEHDQDFVIRRARLTDVQYQLITDELNRRIDKATGPDVQTSSLISSNDPSAYIFQPIYECACEHNEEMAALFFEQIVWRVFIERKDHWSYEFFQNRAFPTTYFRISWGNNVSKH